VATNSSIRKKTGNTFQIPTFHERTCPHALSARWGWTAARSPRRRPAPSFSFPGTSAHHSREEDEAEKKIHALEEEIAKIESLVIPVLLTLSPKKEAAAMLGAATQSTPVRLGGGVAMLIFATCAFM
jgi:hypothetical protein